VVAQASAPRAKPEVKPPPKPEAKPEPKPEAKPEPKPEPKPPTTAEPAPAGRFVVQVGAFGEASSATAARQKLEKLGVKTYTQEVEVNGQRRIRVRVGPFDTRADASRVAGCPPRC
jgi:DedD protein